MADLNLLDKSFGSLTKYSDKLQFVLCGFDTRGSVTEINAETKEQKKIGQKDMSRQNDTGVSMKTTGEALNGWKRGEAEKDQNHKQEKKERLGE